MYDLIIIGGGPAGLSAAMYAVSKHLNVLVVCDELEGKVAWRQHLVGQPAAHYLLGDESVRHFAQQLAANPACILRDHTRSVVCAGAGFQIETQHHGPLNASALLIATGAKPVLLGVPGEQELLGRGIGYSATTHAGLAAGKTVAVIGSTARAFRSAAELAQSATQVYLIAPDVISKRMPLANQLRRCPQVTLLESHEVLAVGGSGFVEQLTIAHDGQQRQLRVDAAFVELGLLPNSSLVRRLVRTDLQGFIWVDARNATTQPGLFAAGDVTTAYCEQVLIAIGEGARAALNAYDYLLTQGVLSERVSVR